MTLFPWPQIDAASPAHRLVFWNRGASSARGLLIDSGAVPLRFADQDADEPLLDVRASAAPASGSTGDDALQRVRRIEHLLAVRELKPR